MANPKMQLKAFPDAPREHVIIELWMDDKPLGHILLDGGTLEDHIHKLAAHRAQLTDEVPRELDPGSRLEAEPHRKQPRRHCRPRRSTPSSSRFG